MVSKRRGPMGEKELRPVMVRLPEPLRLRLAQFAAEEGRSMNAEIIFRLEHALAGPSTADQLATIARDLQTFLKTLQAQQRAMLEQDKRAATPRKEMQDLREELQKINSVMNDIRNDYVHLTNRLIEAKD